jgi:hypothetical protein
VTDELTQFKMGADHKVFWIPGDYDTNEYSYSESKLSEVDAIAKGAANRDINTQSVCKERSATPLMMKTAQSTYINIHEAALVNYPAMDLTIDGFVLTSHLVPDAVGNKAYLRTTDRTPWRVINYSDKATGILASRVILNLNEPSVIKNTSWIKPMKFVGVWWEMHVNRATWDYAEHKMLPILRSGNEAKRENTEPRLPTLKKYIDFAAKNGIEGVLVEGWDVGWEDWFGKWKEEVFDFVTPYPDYNVPELHKYAEAKGVKNYHAPRNFRLCNQL